MIIYKILYVVALVIQFIFVPKFLKIGWHDISSKSRFYKMICSSAFICTGIASIQISGHTGAYSKFIMIALIFSWFGDLFLHINDDSTLFFCLGALSFLIGHVFYISAYRTVQISLLGNTTLLSTAEIIAIIAVLIIVSLIMFVAIKLRPGVLTAPISVYAVVLSAMFVKAVSFSIGILRAGTAVENGAAIAALLIIGASLFVISDATLAIVTCDEERNTFKLKTVNIVTYFTAQVLLASTIMFIK